MKKFIKKTIALYLCAILIIFSFQPTNASANTYMGYKDFKKTKVHYGGRILHTIVKRYIVSMVQIPTTSLL